MKSILLVFSFVLLSSCKTQGWIEQADLSDTYKINSSKPFVEYRLFHFSNDSSTVFIHFQLPVETIALVPFTLKYQYFDNNNTSNIADSGRLFFTNSSSVVYAGNIRIRGNSKGILKLELKYQSVFTKNVQFIPIDKLNHSNQFFTYETENGTAPDYVIGTNPVKISYYDNSVAKLWVQFYNKSFGPARSPAYPADKLNFSYTPDSVFQIENNGSFTPFANGLYKISVNQSDLFGITLCKFYDTYPLVSTLDVMAQSLRYIATNEEYDGMKAEDKTKIRLDSFWMARAKSDVTSAQKLIKIYYNRVQHANMLFTSYQEGWKTDRGMIYIVYGEPDKVYFYDNYETWIYEAVSDLPQLSFIFRHKENPFTLNEFDLDRHSDYYDLWHVASFRWRNGVVTE